MGTTRRLLVVGGTGFLGHHILEKSVDLGFKSTSVSLHKPKYKKRIKGVDYIQLDIRKKKNFLQLKNNFDFIINVGGYGGYNKKNNIYSENEAQYKGLKNLASFFLKKKIKKFVQIGTSLEYGNNKSPNNEKMASHNPFTSYGRSKLYATNYLKFLNKHFNFPSVILRLYQVYGPRQDNSRLIGYIFNSIRKNKKIYVSSGEQKRDFLYVTDFVDAVFSTLKNKKSSGEIINIGYGKPHKVKHVIKKILNLFPNKNIQLIIKRTNKKEIKKLFPNISKAKKLINWKPRIKLITGLSKIKEN